MRKLNIIAIPNGLTQTIVHPTRITPLFTSLIDLHFTDCEHVASTGVIHLGLSDHSLTYLIKKQKTPLKKNSTFQARSYKNFDETTFKNLITDIDWSGVFPDPYDINIAWSSIETSIINALNTMCPITSIKTSKIRAYWMTPELLSQIRNKDQLMEKARLTKSKDDWITARIARNRIQNLVNRTKSKFYIAL